MPRGLTSVSEDASDMSLSPRSDAGDCMQGIAETEGRVQRGRVQRGLCGGCGRGVFRGEKRMRDAGGAYFHTGCYQLCLSANGMANDPSGGGARSGPDCVGGGGPPLRMAALEFKSQLCRRLELLPTELPVQGDTPAHEDEAHTARDSPSPERTQLAHALAQSIQIDLEGENPRLEGERDSRPQTQNAETLPAPSGMVSCSRQIQFVVNSPNSLASF